MPVSEHMERVFTSVAQTAKTGIGPIYYAQNPE